MSKVKFSEMSDVICMDCLQPLKQNLVDRKEKIPAVCYSCFRTKRAKKKMKTARECRVAFKLGDRIGRDGGRYTPIK